MKEVFNIVLFSFFGKDFTLLEVVITLVSLAVVIFTYRKAMDFFAPKMQRSLEISEKNQKRLKSIIRWIVVFLVALVTISVLDLDYELYSKADFRFTINHLVKALLFWQLALLLDWVINNLFIDYFYPKDANPNDMKRTAAFKGARRTVQYTFFLIVIIYIITNFELDYVLHTFEIKGDPVPLSLSNIFSAILIIFIGQLIVWAVIHLILLKIYERRNIDVGAQFAINQLVKYVVYTFAIFYALDTLGFNMTLILGGAAALLVGIGLGLQQTFNDFISGVVLLFERTVSVGDVLEFDGTVGVVRKIGLRSSIVHTRLNVSMVVPNHLLVNEKVTNWTHFDDSIRFSIEVGVAYGSDTDLVKRLLVKAVNDSHYVLNTPAPFVRFLSFGNSSLDFALYFFSREYLIIEDIKSDLRLNIDRLFREHKISIPFPQRVVTINKPG